MTNDIPTCGARANKEIELGRALIVARTREKSTLTDRELFTCARNTAARMQGPQRIHKRDRSTSAGRGKTVGHRPIAASTHAAASGVLAAPTAPSLSLARGLPAADRLAARRSRRREYRYPASVGASSKCQTREARECHAWRRAAGRRLQWRCSEQTARPSARDARVRRVRARRRCSPVSFEPLNLASMRR